MNVKLTLLCTVFILVTLNSILNKGACPALIYKVLCRERNNYIIALNIKFLDIQRYIFIYGFAIIDLS